jgi:hypothetical protein
MKTPNFPTCVSFMISRRGGGKKLGFAPAVFLPCLALTAAAADVPVGYTADFEAPAYKLGSIHGQQGWAVDQGKAEVVKGAGMAGSAGLVLYPADPFAQARLSVRMDRPAAALTFVDL